VKVTSATLLFLFENCPLHFSSTRIFPSLSLLLAPNIDMAALNDDQNGWYTVDVGETQFTLPVRYQNPTPVGRGAFGAVM
jgi:hypothetical protein